MKIDGNSILITFLEMLSLLKKRFFSSLLFLCSLKSVHKIVGLTWVELEREDDYLAIIIFDSTSHINVCGCLLVENFFVVGPTSRIMNSALIC